MGVEDKIIARALQREFNRRQSLDVTDVKIAVMRGTAYISGTLRPSPGMYTIDMKEELRAIEQTSRKVPNLRDVVFDQLKIEMSTKR